MFVNSAVSKYPSLAFQFAFDQAGENFHTAALMLRWTRILVRLRRCCQEDSSMTWALPLSHPAIIGNTSAICEAGSAPLPMPTEEERAEMRALDAKLDALAARLKG